MIHIQNIYLDLDKNEQVHFSIKIVCPGTLTVSLAMVLSPPLSTFKPPALSVCWTVPVLVTLPVIDKE